MEFSENLTYLRRKRAMTQGEVAEKLGISQKTISSYETGRRRPRLKELARLAQFYGVSIDDLLTNNMRLSNCVFGNNLKALRKKEGYTKQEMAKLLGYGEKQVYRAIENGCTDIPLDMLVNISEFFGVPIDDLLKKDLSKEGERNAGCSNVPAPRD